MTGGGFAVLCAGEMMGGVGGSFLARAARGGTAPLDENEAGGEDGSFGVQIFEAGLEVAPDEGGMFWDFHKAEGEFPMRVITDMYYYLSDKATKIDEAKKYLLRPGGGALTEKLIPLPIRGSEESSEVRKKTIPQSCVPKQPFSLWQGPLNLNEVLRAPLRSVLRLCQYTQPN